MTEKRTRRITKKKVFTGLKIGGKESDRSGVWERLVAIIFDRLSLSGSIGREIEETSIEEYWESNEDIETVVLEQEEAKLTEDTRKMLGSEAIQHEQRLFAQGKVIDQDNINSEELAMCMYELNQELISMRNEGYEVEIKSGNTDSRENSISNMPINDLELSVRARVEFRKLHIETIQQLVLMTEQELLSEEFIGQKSVNEIKRQLFKLGLKLKDS